MQCSVCGHQNGPADTFCVGCGRLNPTSSLDWAPSAFSDVELLDSRVVNRKLETAEDLALSSTEVDVSDPSGFFDRPLLRPFSDALSEYTIIRKLGEGGQGSVYLATQQHLQRKVAIKIVSPSHEDAERLIERLKREALSLASLEHPCVIPLYDMFQSDGRLCIVMGFAEGGSIEDMLARHRRLPEAEAAAIVRQTALGLCALAEEGIVHRDIKPGNLMLTKNGSIKIADLGLAKVSEAALSLTRSDAVVGTPAYIAPEQWDKEQDHRSDLYSLGCTLYELLVGDPPFDGQDAEVYFLQHINDVPVDLRAILPDVSEAMAGIVKKLLQKNPESRFQTGYELADALAPLAANARLGRGLDAFIAQPRPLRRVSRVSARPAAPRTWLYVVGLAAALGLGIALGALLPW